MNNYETTVVFRHQENIRDNYRVSFLAGSFEPFLPDHSGLNLMRYESGDFGRFRQLKAVYPPVQLVMNNE